MRTLLFIAFLTLSSRNISAQHIQLGIQADFFSLGLFSEYHFSDDANLGVEGAFGYSSKATFGSNGYTGMLENLSLSAYYSKKIRGDRNILGKAPKLDSSIVVLSILPPVKWTWDFGARWSPAVMILDNSPKHGFSHMYAAYAFIRLKRQLFQYLQMGTSLGIGHNGQVMLLLGNIEGRFVFPLHW